MPNHVINVLTIGGVPQDVAVAFKKIKGSKKSSCPYIDFNKIIRMPKTLQSLESGSESMLAKDIIAETLKKIGMRLDISGTARLKMTSATLVKFKRHLKQIVLDNIDKIQGIGIKEYLECFIRYGYTDWYDWSCAMWGTKWDAYAQTRISKETISFQTAWSTPEPVIKALSKKFPLLTFTVAYADEDLGNNTGKYTYASGRIVSEETYDKDFGLEFACGLWGYDIEEIKKEREENS